MDEPFRSADIDACVAAYNPADVDLSRGTVMTLDPSLGTSDPTL
jgi:hypothetical protein